MSQRENAELLEVLKKHFEKNMHRHKDITWSRVPARLLGNPQILWSLNQMEETGGGPHVIAYDKKSNQYTFFDCSPETPKDRRNVCYDRQALDAGKEHKPKNGAIDMAKEWA